MTGRIAEGDEGVLNFWCRERPRWCVLGKLVGCRFRTFSGQRLHRQGTPHHHHYSKFPLSRYLGTSVELQPVPFRLVGHLPNVTGGAPHLS